LRVANNPEIPRRSSSKTSWGLHLNQTENAVVPCVNEQSQIQALEPTQPMLPMGLGDVEGATQKTFLGHQRCDIISPSDVFVPGFGVATED